METSVYDTKPELSSQELECFPGSHVQDCLIENKLEETSTHTITKVAL